MKVLVTGSCGLIGSEAVRYYEERAELVLGIDSNMRAEFFGPDGSTIWVRNTLHAECPKYRHVSVDIRNREEMSRIIGETKPDPTIHCAAQPSHDLAAQIPFKDFEVNAVGTLNPLEATRHGAPDSVFIFMSTNKVYGDAPKRIKLKELPTRWDYDDAQYVNGIPESFRIDQSTHSLFGESKVAADVLVQEYGLYFGMKTGAFRGGCLTGPSHSGAELHGKQVRDQIHSADVIQAFDEFYNDPKCGAVYNLGKGKQNSVSILECIDRVEQLHTEN